MTDVKVVVLIVTYNGREWVDKCIGSLGESTIPLKPIVIDNASEDGTVRHVRNNYPGVSVFENLENLGFGKANNIGLELAIQEKADYAFLLNQDAWIEPDSIDKLVNVHKKNGDYGILSPMHLNGKGNALEYYFSQYIAPDKCPHLISDLYTKPDGLKSVYDVEFVNAAAWLVSMETVDAIGGFDPTFPHYGEDRDYINRMNYHGLKLGVVPEARICHDREGRPIDYRSFKRQYIKTLVIAKNINDGFFTALFKAIKENTAFFLKGLLSLKLNHCWSALKIYVYLIFKLPNVFSKRGKTIEKGRSFLNLNR